MTVTRIARRTTRIVRRRVNRMAMPPFPIKGSQCLVVSITLDTLNDLTKPIGFWAALGQNTSRVFRAPHGYNALPLRVPPVNTGRRTPASSPDRRPPRRPDRRTLGSEPRWPATMVPGPPSRRGRGTTHTTAPRSPGHAPGPDLPNHPQFPEPEAVPHRKLLGRQSRTTLRGGVASGADDTDGMGLDPRRPHRRRPSDVVYVGAAILVAVLLLVWAIFL